MEYIEQLHLHAKTYCNRGWKVLPLFGVIGGRCECSDPFCSSPGKHPRIKFEGSSSEYDVVSSWILEWPNMNIGLCVGESGYCLIDVDNKPKEGKDGFASLSQLEAELGILPSTLTTKTGSSGKHFLFKDPKKLVKQGTAFRPGIDTRSGKNSLAVLEPSRHASGGHYACLVDSEIADIPLSWAQFFGKPRQKAAEPLGVRGRVVHDGEGREEFLTKVAFLLKRHDLLTENILEAVNEDFVVPPKSSTSIREKVHRINISYPPTAIIGIDGDFNPFLDEDSLPDFKTAKKLIPYYMEKRHAVYQYKKGNVVWLEGGGERAKDVGKIRSDLILDAGEANLRIPESHLDAALEKWIEQQRENILENYKTRLAFDPTASDGFSDFTLALTGRRHPLHDHVLKHFVWQVKRKMAGLEVIWHMMPAFTGKTHAGKSRAIRAFLAPLNDLYNEPFDLKELSDSRNLRLLETYYALYFDEMVNADKANVEALKNIITSEDFAQRIMYTDSHRTVTNNATFIGSSNNDLIDMIRDPKSARRYWEIRCQAKLNWEWVQGFDFLSLWKCVDENAPTPLLNVLRWVLYYQNLALRSHDTIEYFFRNHCTPMDKDDERKGLNGDELYEAYRDAITKAGYNYAHTKQKFLKDFIKLAGKPQHTKTGNYHRIQVLGVKGALVAVKGLKG